MPELSRRKLIYCCVGSVCVHTTWFNGQNQYSRHETSTTQFDLIMGSMDIDPNVGLTFINNMSRRKNARNCTIVHLSWAEWWMSSKANNKEGKKERERANYERNQRKWHQPKLWNHQAENENGTLSLSRQQPAQHHAKVCKQWDSLTLFIKLDYSWLH